MTLTASNLLRRIEDTGPITLVISGVEFYFNVHSSYQVIRLLVNANVNDQTDTIQRIYVDNTSLREVSMHIADCLDRMVHNTTMCWPSILETLYDLLRGHPEWTDALPNQGE